MRKTVCLLFITIYINAMHLNFGYIWNSLFPRKEKKEFELRSLITNDNDNTDLQKLVKHIQANQNLDVNIINDFPYISYLIHEYKAGNKKKYIDKIELQELGLINEETPINKFFLKFDGRPENETYQIKVSLMERIVGTKISLKKGGGTKEDIVIKNIIRNQILGIISSYSIGWKNVIEPNYSFDEITKPTKVSFKSIVHERLIENNVDNS